MNDDFIYKALPDVREDFAESLYARLASQSATAAQSRNSQKIRNLRWVYAGMLVLSLLLVAWSQIRLWIRYVPIGDLWIVEFGSTQPANDTQTIETIPTPGKPPTALMSDGTESILVYILPGATYLSPDWLPEGFSATKIPGAGYAWEESIGMWSNPAGETIRLFVVPKTGGARPYAPPGMYEEVHLNGQPAILVFGRLAPNPPENPQARRKWDRTLGLQLTWSLGDSIYTLETLGSYVTEADLIRMAESLRTTSPPP
jgi:hypothetical protein